MENSLTSSLESEMSQSGSISPVQLSTVITKSASSSNGDLSMLNISSCNNNGETFMVNGEEVAVEPLESNPLDGKDENCKNCL